MTKPTAANYLAQIAAYEAMTSDQLAVVPPGDLTAWLAVVSMLGVSDATMDGAFANIFSELSLRAKSAITTRGIGATPITAGAGEAQVLGYLSRPELVTVGSVIRVRAMGVLDKPVGDVTSTWRIRIGDPSLAGAIVARWEAALGISERSSVPFVLTADVKMIAIGAAGSAWGVVSVTLDDPTVVAKPAIVTAPVAVDFSPAQLVELTCDSGSASCTWTVVSATAELLRA